MAFGQIPDISRVLQRRTGFTGGAATQAVQPPTAAAPPPPPQRTTAQPGARPTAATTAAPAPPPRATQGFTGPQPARTQAPQQLTSSSFMQTIQGFPPNAQGVRDWFQQVGSQIPGLSFIDHPHDPAIILPNGTAIDPIQNAGTPGARFQFLVKGPHGGGGFGGGFGGGGGFAFSGGQAPDPINLDKFFQGLNFQNQGTFQTNAFGQAGGQPGGTGVQAGGGGAGGARTIQGPGGAQTLEHGSQFRNKQAGDSFTGRVPSGPVRVGRFTVDPQEVADHLGKGRSFERLLTKMGLKANANNLASKELGDLVEQITGQPRTNFFRPGGAQSKYLDNIPGNEGKGARGAATGVGTSVPRDGTETGAEAPKDFNTQARDSILQALGQAQETPTIDDPILRGQQNAFVRGQERAQERANIRNAEALTAQGLGGSGAAEVEREGLQQQFGESTAANASRLVQDELVRRRGELQNLLGLAGQLGDRDLTRTLQEAIANADRALQSKLGFGNLALQQALGQAGLNLDQLLGIGSLQQGFGSLGLQGQQLGLQGQQLGLQSQAMSLQDQLARARLAEEQRQFDIGLNPFV